MTTFKHFTRHNDTTWKKLTNRQFPNTLTHASKMHSQSIEALSLSLEKVPNFEEISEKLDTKTGWKLKSTPIQFSDELGWFTSLSEKVFLITEYIRDGSDLDYTPLPDIFHDGFGHIPFLAIQEYANIVEKFAITFLKTNDIEKRKLIAKIWWFTLEFGFIMENNTIKAIGAGLMSSHGELLHAISNNVAIESFSVEGIMHEITSPHAFHTKYFVIKNLKELNNILDTIL